MMRQVRDLRVILAGVLVISWVGAGTAGYLMVKSNNAQLAAKQSQITALQATINQVGQLVPVYRLDTNVQTGQQITSSQLQQMNVPASIAPYFVSNEVSVLGQYYKEDTSSGAPLLKDNVYPDRISNSDRLYDVVLDDIPIGLQVGDYVDIRISFPTGQDYIGISHRRVYAIDGSVIKLAVNEANILDYNSMLIDSMIYPGTQIYATQYIEGAAQKPAVVDYPMSVAALTVAERDPNLLSAIQANILDRREALTRGLSATDLSNASSQTVQQEIQQGRNEFESQIVAAEQQYAQQQQLAQQQAAQKAQQAAQAAAQQAAIAAQNSANSSSNSSSSSASSSSGN